MNPTDHEPRSEDDILIACALRFDGYKYGNESQFDHIAAFHTIDQTGDLRSFAPLQQLTLFFMLQRFLYKWGGERLSRRSPEWRTFRELFLCCCKTEIPDAYRQEPYYSEWEQTYASRANEWVTMVRRIHESTAYLPVAAADPND